MDKEQFAKVIGVSLPQLYLMLRGELKSVAARCRRDCEATRHRNVGAFGRRADAGRIGRGSLGRREALDELTRLPGFIARMAQTLRSEGCLAGGAIFLMDVDAAGRCSCSRNRREPELDRDSFFAISLCCGIPFRKTPLSRPGFDMPTWSRLPKRFRNVDRPLNKGADETSLLDDLLVMKVARKRQYASQIKKQTTFHSKHYGKKSNVSDVKTPADEKPRHSYAGKILNYRNVKFGGGRSRVPKNTSLTGSVNLPYEPDSFSVGNLENAIISVRASIRSANKV